MPQTLLSLLSLFVILGVCTLAALVGGRSERMGALAFLVSIVASITVQQMFTIWDPVWPLMGVDVALLAVFSALAWRRRRGWPAWAVALQGLTVAVDSLRAAELGMEPYTYLAAVNLATYALTAVIGYAGWAAWRKRRAA